MSASEIDAREARELEQAERVREACAQVVAHHLFDEGFDGEVALAARDALRALDLSALLAEVKP